MRGARARRPAIGWAAAFALAFCGPGVGAAAGVQIAADVQQHLGIKTQKLAPAKHAVEIDAFAKVLDPGPLAQLVSDLETAEAAVIASGPEARRATILHASGNGVSAKDAEAAVAQARSDALKVVALRRRLGLEWGPGVARMTDARRSRMVSDLAAGKIALVHVDTHNNDGQAGAKSVRIDVGSDSVRGSVIGPARVAEPRLQSSGLIVEVAGPSALLLSVGLTQSAHIETKDPQTGVVAPREAVIRFRGADWVYVRSGPTTFDRRLVVSPLPETGGLFVTQGLGPADEVAVKGAAALFAAEQNSATGAR